MSPLVKILSILFIPLGFTSISVAQKFYEAEDADSAQVKFFIADSPEQADLHFCIIYEASEITKPGIMMEVETPKEADIILIFVDSEKDADIKVWLIDTPAEVKWLNESKKKLLSVKGLK
ncbi:MAG TPA: hypothetical protein ENN49_02350 [Bacteroidales bacterium]|nr:hypothetical protein [Bacteroidales bacterium]